MKKYIVTYQSNPSQPIRRDAVSAHYYKHEDGWLVFKNEAHAAVKEFREADISSITVVGEGDSINLCAMGLHSGPFAIATMNRSQGVTASCCGDFV